MLICSYFPFLRLSNKVLLNQLFDLNSFSLDYKDRTFTGEVSTRGGDEWRTEGTEASWNKGKFRAC